MTLSEIWSYEFLRYALLSAVVLGPTCALLGVFVTLRGMAFFSDALAHSSVTGLALGWFLREALGFPVEPAMFVIGFSLVLAVFMQWLMQRTTLSPDTIIAFSFTGSVALGVIIVSTLDRYRLLDSILFGSIYANGPRELVRQCLLAVGVFGFLLWQMRSLTLATLSPTIAAVQKVPTGFLTTAFSVLIAATITIALPMLGALLLSALIVIPAATAKLLSRSFRQMLVLALIIGLVAPPAGVVLSCKSNLPTAPTIVLTNVAILLAAHALRSLQHILKKISPSSISSLL